MLKSLLQDTKLLVLLLLAVAVKFFSIFPYGVEHWYTTGFYPGVAKIQRTVLGPLPFSLGDVLYGLAGLYLVYLCWKGLRALKKHQWTAAFFTSVFSKLMQLALVVYLVFNVLWGLNYNRLGIAYQLALPVQRYTLTDVQELTGELQQRLNKYAARVDTAKRGEEEKRYYTGAVAAYRQAATKLPFLTYNRSCVKPSLYSGVGHFIGFTGYYNPFSGEAQINTTVPTFLKPFVVAHEIAHQLGYAKENEANFVAFLSSKSATDVAFQYSMYYQLYRYAVREVYSRDTTLAAAFMANLHPQVKRDNEELKAYFLRTTNKIEPLMSAVYDRFLKLNDQKKGVQTYNEVVALLIAYRKKYGTAAL